MSGHRSGIVRAQCIGAVGIPVREAAPGVAHAGGIDRSPDRIGSGIGFPSCNPVAFGQSWGHRNDVPGFYMALREFDDALPAFTAALHEDDLFFIAADHRNGPKT